MEEIGTAGWVAIFTAIGTVLTGIIGAIFAGLKYLKIEDNKMTLAVEKVKAANLKLENTYKVKDQTETIKQLSETLVIRSKEVHDANNRTNSAELKNAANEARFQQMEQRLEDCEQDRAKMWAALNAHGITKIIPPTQ